MNTPERHTPIYYQSNDGSQGITEIFEDPDYVDFLLYNNSKQFELTWATGKTALEALATFEEFVHAEGNKRGVIRLASSNENPASSESVKTLEGNTSDIIGMVKESSERVVAFQVKDSTTSFIWRPSWPKTFHDIRSNEITILEKRPKSTRPVIERCVAQTALPGFMSVAEGVLDQFGKYAPSLKR